MSAGLICTEAFCPVAFNLITFLIIYLFIYLFPPSSAGSSPWFSSPKARARADFVVIITRHNQVNVTHDVMIRHQLSQAVL